MDGGEYNIMLLVSLQ